MTVLCLFV